MMPGFSTFPLGGKKWMFTAFLAISFPWGANHSIRAQTGAEKTGRSLLAEQAESLRPLVGSRIGQSFLDRVRHLPQVTDRVIWYDAENRQAMTTAQAESLTAEQLANFQSTTLDEHYFYFTRYGTPLAFVRTLEIVATTGTDSVSTDSLTGQRIVDFGFGTIGHLRLLASLGADVTGIEVDSRLQALYSQPGDVGVIKNVTSSGGHPAKNDGHLRLLFGQFPVDAAIRNRVPRDVDLFISKNTLKRGYIHPERPVDPRRLVHLGCSDEVFLQSVHQQLKVGGYFLIYNLHPAPSRENEPYKPWSDGRSPFDRAALAGAGFEVIAFDVDDTAAAREMGRALKWDSQMDLQNDLFATYTLVRKN